MPEEEITENRREYVEQQDVKLHVGEFHFVKVFLRLSQSLSGFINWVSASWDSVSIWRKQKPLP
jgi:hypothetical protein